jgi:hypothetical protein
VPYVRPKSSGSPQWQAIYAVLTHPRCINCHTIDDSPRQTDQRFPHVFNVIKGPDDRGVEMKRWTKSPCSRDSAVLYL